MLSPRGRADGHSEEEEAVACLPACMPYSTVQNIEGVRMLLWKRWQAGGYCQSRRGPRARHGNSVPRGGLRLTHTHTHTVIRINIACKFTVLVSKYGGPLARVLEARQALQTANLPAYSRARALIEASISRPAHALTRSHACEWAWAEAEDTHANECVQTHDLKPQKRRPHTKTLSRPSAPPPRARVLSASATFVHAGSTCCANRRASTSRAASTSRSSAALPSPGSSSPSHSAVALPLWERYSLYIIFKDYGTVF